MTWHVKQSLPLINETFEEGLHRHLRSYALKEKNVIVHEVGGTETHVHMAVSIPPTPSDCRLDWEIEGFELLPRKS